MLSARSGVAKTTIYRHWPERQQLLLDAFRSVKFPPEHAPRFAPTADLYADLVRGDCSAMSTRPHPDVIWVRQDGVHASPHLAPLKGDLMSLLESAPRRMGAFAREGTKTYRANRVYDKLGMLVGITVVTGAITASMIKETTSLGFFLPAMLVALGCAIAGSFKPNLAKTLAPIYALAEGAVLGALSKIYSNVSGGIVPTAIVLTGAIFIGCLLVFRTGIVKVTPRFTAMVGIGMMALFVLYLASMFGLSVPGINDIRGGLIFGIIGLALGIGRLFIDFDRVQKFEGAGSMTDSAEWFLSMQLLISLVFIYINVLRVLAANGRRN